MTTMHAPEIGVHRRHIDLWRVAVIGLAAALVALGAWVLVDRYTGPEYDAATLVDDLGAAWSTGDADAIRSLYTTDAIVVTAWGDRYVGLDQIVDEVSGAVGIGFKTERIAPVTVEGDYATTFLRYSTAGGEEGTLVSVYELQDGKILRMWDFEPGVTSPLTNAVTP